MLKGKPAVKNKPASTKSEKLRKRSLAVTEANIAHIEADERGEKSKADAKAPAKGGKTKTPRVAKPPKEKRMSGLDAAAKVLVESKEPLTAQDIVKAMETKGFWKSPGGKTPHATIYAAMVREIKEKGKDARFKKVDLGMFAARK